MKAPRIETRRELVQHDGFCQACDWRSSCITKAGVSKDARAHARANPGHQARLRTIVHASFVGIPACGHRNPVIVEPVTLCELDNGHPGAHWGRSGTTTAQWGWPPCMEVSALGQCRLGEGHTNDHYFGRAR